MIWKKRIEKQTLPAKVAGPIGIVSCCGRRIARTWSLKVKGDDNNVWNVLQSWLRTDQFESCENTKAISLGPKFLPEIQPGWINHRFRSIGIRCWNVSCSPKLCFPAKTSMLPRVEVSVKQCAAVITQTGLKIAPPQTWS